jgi:hypothetical protein
MSTPGETTGTPVGQLPQFRVVGFTGHRHLADHAGASRAIQGAIDALRREVPGEWIALSSIAGGGDQLFVREALASRLSWHAILPLPRSEFALDFTPADWTAVEEMLTNADHVRVISESGDRKDSYLDCGIETVNGADVLIALWDGEPARGKGGTADVVQYAQSIGKPVIIIDAVTHEVHRENWSRLESSDAVLADLNALPDVAGTSSDNPFMAPDAIYRFQQKCDDVSGFLAHPDSQEALDFSGHGDPHHRKHRYRAVGRKHIQVRGAGKSPRKRRGRDGRPAGPEQRIHGKLVGIPGGRRNGIQRLHQHFAVNPFCPAHDQPFRPRNRLSVQKRRQRQEVLPGRCREDVSKEGGF